MHVSNILWRELKLCLYCPLVDIHKYIHTTSDCTVESHEKQYKRLVYCSFWCLKPPFFVTPTIRPCEKASGSIEGYGKKVLSCDLCKDFPDDFMDSVTHFRLCCIKNKDFKRPNVFCFFAGFFFKCHKDYL